MVTNPSVFKGTFKNRDLFLQAFHDYLKTHNITKAIYKHMSEATGLTLDVLHRLVNGTKDSREGGYELQPSPEVARLLENFYAVPRGTWGGKDPVEDAPLTGLQDPAPEVSIPEPTPRANRTHTVMDVTGADLEEPGKATVESGFYLVPLDKLGEWGRTMINLCHPYLQGKAIANQIPILVECSKNYETLVFTAPLPGGEHKTTTLPTASVGALLGACKWVSGQEAMFILTEIYTGLIGVRMEEVKNKALGKATMKDQLGALRQHIGDLEQQVAALGPFAIALRDAEHDITQALGTDNPVALTLLELVDRFDDIRQDFRALTKAIQGNAKT